MTTQSNKNREAGHFADETLELIEVLEGQLPGHSVLSVAIALQTLAIQSLAQLPPAARPGAVDLAGTIAMKLRKAAR